MLEVGKVVDFMVLDEDLLILGCFFVGIVVFCMIVDGCMVYVCVGVDVCLGGFIC